MKKFAIGAVTALVLALFLVVGALGSVAAVAAPAGCVYGPSTSGGVVTTTAGGKSAPKGDAVELTTTVVDDAVVWRYQLAAPVPLGSVTELSYRARKLDDGKTNAAAMPAYRVYLDNGKTLYFEPYYQISGNPPLDVWTKYDVDGGKFWQTGEGGGSYAGNRTLAQFKALYPDAKVVAIGVGQGTYNAGTIGRFKDVVFKASVLCVKPSASASSASSSASANPSASSSTSTPPVAAGLPVTGAPVGLLLGVGFAVTVGGIALFIAARRRHRFTP